MTDFRLNRRRFNRMVASASLMSYLGSDVTSAADSATIATGPLVGHVSESAAMIWFRPGVAGIFRLLVRKADGGEPATVTAESDSANDYCVTWRIEDLQAGTAYGYSIRPQSDDLTELASGRFTTDHPPGVPAKVCLAFGSCADSESNSLWTQMQDRGAEALVLLGDTPYIDSADLAVARRRHREFLAIPELAELVRNTPTWGTWDDHDFGLNASDGRFPSKHNTRQAFVEYRAQELPAGEQGIHTRFRRGPVEVFLLDTRWYSQTEKSPVDPAKPTLLGTAQWNWLRQSLRASTAPFKVIACGMIWDDKQNREADDWGTYTHEREALFVFLGREKIGGVILIGGDIHCSRWLRYRTEAQVGYALHQFIVSPIHERVIPSLNVPHPDLIRGAAVPHVWLRLTADTTVTPAALHAEWVQRDGQPMWDVTLNAGELGLS